MKKVIKWLIDVSFRPPRYTYDPENTASAITYGNTVFVRQDVEFKNNKDLKLRGSLWYDREYPIPENCLIYLHSLGTNQFECLNLVSFMCSEQLCIFSFDFSGCGISEGSYIPLDGSGINDVLAAKEELDARYHFSKYALWGRSMGAAIALHCASATSQFACCVSDSAYKDTQAVVMDQAEMNGIPGFVISILKPLIKYHAENLLGTNIINSYPISEVPSSRTPLLMGHGKQDSFIPLNQAQILFENYGCNDKQLYVFDAMHNTLRPSVWYEAASRFIYRKLGLNILSRHYEIFLNASFIHSGLKSQILEDIDEKIERDLQISEELKSLHKPLVLRDFSRSTDSRSTTQI